MSELSSPIGFADVLAQSPYAQLLGVEMQLINGTPQFVLPFRPENIGNDHLPALHGGVIGGFMETAGILHLLWLRESTETPRTVDFSIDYLRAGRAQTLFAECSVTRQGKRVANVHVSAWQESRDKPVAVARAHFLLA
jgi:uncharacterized protein (TIGR00369 family)